MKAKSGLSWGTTLLLISHAIATPLSLQRRRSCLPPSTSTYTANISFVGCYTDNSDRVLRGGQANNLPNGNSPQACGEACGNAGFAYAGVEYSRFVSFVVDTLLKSMLTYKTKSMLLREHHPELCPEAARQRLYCVLQRQFFRDLWRNLAVCKRALDFLDVHLS